MKTNQTASIFIIVTLSLALLVLAQSILIPFVIALIIWFVIKKLRDLIDKLPFMAKYIPRWIKNLFAATLVFGILFLTTKLLMANIEILVGKYDNYAPNVEIIGHRINELFGIDVQDELTNFIKNFDFTQHLETFINSISEVLGDTLLITLYLAFLFLEEALFSAKLKKIFSSDEGKLKNYNEIMGKIDKSMSGYISLKSLIALMNATLAFFVFLGVGIDAPVFWAFLVFLFNFIPSVGPIMGTLFPALFCLIQFGTFTPFLIVLFGVGGIGVLISSLVEPKMMGNTLNISPLVTILALAVWGSIWGIMGALLSVPISVAMIITLAQFPTTRPFAILLSERGRV